MNAAAAIDEPFDLVIAGGGTVGAALALALVPLGLRVALVESAAPQSGAAPQFDERSIALANGSVRIFKALAAWEGMQREATPIRRIHVSERGRFGAARIDAREQGLEALGQVVPQRVIAAALWSAVSRVPGIEVFAPARVAGSELDGDRRRVRIESEHGNRTLTSRLLVAADGAQSTVRADAGIGAVSWDYEQCAVVAVVATSKFHDHVAYERFTQDGPIALLPLSDGRCGLVWTQRPEAAQRLLALDDRQFLIEFERAFGLRLGRFLRVGARQGWPLALSRADRHAAARLAVVGNAAQGLHPIAGQGFNLGLRDAVSLAETLADASREGRTDPGNAETLARYAAWRDEDRGRIVAFTDGLVRVFDSPLASLRVMRGLGLLAFDVLPPAKTAMARLSTGAAGRVPRLARGVSLLAANDGGLR